MDPELKEALGPLADFDDGKPVPIEDQIGALQREMSLRVRVYPKWVETGRLTEKQAKIELKRMKAALQTLVNIKAEMDRMSGIEPQPSQLFQM